MGNYLLPESAASANERFVSFSAFYAYSESINSALAPDGRKYHSAAVELFKRSADRSDIAFDALKEADALAHLAAVVKGERWYPQTHYYWGYGSRVPLFIRATQHKHFAKLATVLGVQSGDQLREIYAAQKAGNTDVGQYSGASFENLINLNKLDTIS